MLRMKPVKSGKRAEQYYARTDGGYYHEANGLRCEWGGKGAAMLGLEGTPDFEQFKRLVHGLDPHTGEQLTAKLVENRIPGWDVTASVPKGVTVALERGDSRVQDAIWQAGREAMAMLEAYATTRVRVGGQQADRKTGNLVWYAVEHPETRPTLEDNMPDPDRHIHFFVSNLTFDAEEDRWKAVKFRPIMDLRKYFDRSFESLLSSKLGSLGYEIETKWERGGKEAARYRTWDIRGIPDLVTAKFSRRTAEVGELEQEILAGMQADGGKAPDQLSAVARDQLGATSRQQKREDLTLDQCRAYWDGRITGDESRSIAETIKRALLGQNPMPENRTETAARFAMEHHFEQRSVVLLEELAITAMEHSLGVATPEAAERELIRQGAIVREIDGRRQATTAAVLREEEAIAAFAAKGLGSVQAVGVSKLLQRGRLNDGQWNAVKGLLASENRVNLVEGPAGAGKSSMLSAYRQGMSLAGQGVTYLATTAKAAEVLEQDGFDAHTLARFLVDERMQNAAKGGRVVVDEASMLGHKDAFRLVQLAETLDLKLILVGDPMQHGSVPRGSLLRLLKAHADIRPFKLTEIMRQEDADYRAAAKRLSEGDTLAGFDALDRKGWVHELTDDQDRYRQMAAEYVGAVQTGKSALVVSPTHAEAAHITAEIRSQLRQAGKLGTEERQFTRLVQVNASEAERGQASTYLPGDVLIFHQNAKGGFTKGDRLTLTHPAEVPLAEAAKFSLYRPEAMGVSQGDRIRFTGTVKTLGGEHTLRNGATKSVAGFDDRGNIRLDNGWIVPADAGLFRHAFVETSFGAQGQTHKRVILGMAAMSTGAMNQEQLYVSATRGKEGISIYTDDKEAVREAVQRSSQKLTALDLVPKPEKPKQPTLAERIRKNAAQQRRRSFMERLRNAWNPQIPAWRPVRLAGASRPITHVEQQKARQFEREAHNER